MRLLNFKKGKAEQLTVEKIEDFYRYSEIDKWAGSSKLTEQFGDSINIVCSYENYKPIYEAIQLTGGKKWAYVSIENGNVKYQCTEIPSLGSIKNCPVTTDEKETSIIAKCLLAWYAELKLPNSICEIQKRLKEQPFIESVKEIPINVFSQEAILRILSDKTTFLIFDMFSPKRSKLTKYQADNFEKFLAEATGKKVVHDDRELFVIFDDSQKMIDDVILFSQNFQ